MNVVAIIQARMGSTRLPGKVLMDLAGEPVLARVMHRAHRARRLNHVVVATTTNPGDEDIVTVCRREGWPFYRGNELDVLDRYYHAACQYKADVVVRITSDCPMIEPEVVDRVVGAYMEGRPAIDYACNFVPHRTFPRGLDTEVFGFEVLERMWREDKNPAWREHVTEYALHHPELFTIHGNLNDADLSHLRWTLDTPQDMDFLLRIFKHFGHDRFTWKDALGLLEAHPEWIEINRDVPQKTLI